MINMPIDLTGKVPAGMAQLYTELRRQTDALGMEMLVVGAMARDLVMVHGYGVTIERGTRDVDFAISVVSWQDFTKLREQLLASEKFTVKKHLHEMEFRDSEGLLWEVDIVPFGDIAENHAISWPPKNDFQMSVLGFEEALASAIPVTIDTEVVINVASPAGICLLKLVAWTDRAVEKRAKDASDIRYLIESYAKIPLISATLYDGGYMEARDWDETLACAIKLGEDTGVIASEDTVAVLHHQLFNNDKNKALFTGGAGSGESEIRRYILESDLLETIVALPTDMFYNTGIATYVWVLCNHKTTERKGKVQLINATSLYAPMRKSLGSKRRYMTDEQIAEVVKQFGHFENSDICKIFNTTEFGYRRVTVERPLKLAFYPQEEQRLVALQVDKAWDKLSGSLQSAIIAGLGQLEPEYQSRDVFTKTILSAVKARGENLSAAHLKLLVKHLGEQSEQAEVCRYSSGKDKGKPEVNPDLRDYENVPLDESIGDYFAREVLPHVPDAWMDTGKTDDKDGLVGIIGYEIPFNRHFYQYQPPRSLEAIDADLDQLSAEIMELLQEVHS